MTTKEYLQQYINAEKRIFVKLAEVERMTSLAEKVTQSLSGERVQTSTYDYENTLAVLADMRAEINEDIEKLKCIKKVVQGAISKVEDSKLQDLLCYRYICDMTFEQIAVNMEYSYVHVVHNLHPKALRQIKYE